MDDEENINAMTEAEWIEFEHDFEHFVDLYEQKIQAELRPSGSGEETQKV